mgnify:CR=1 FL=1
MAGFYTFTAFYRGFGTGGDARPQSKVFVFVPFLKFREGIRHFTTRHKVLASLHIGVSYENIAITRNQIVGFDEVRANINHLQCPEQIRGLPV